MVYGQWLQVSYSSFIFIVKLLLILLRNLFFLFYNFSNVKNCSLHAIMDVGSELKVKQERKLVMHNMA